MLKQASLMPAMTAAGSRTSLSGAECLWLEQNAGGFDVEVELLNQRTTYQG